MRFYCYFLLHTPNSFAFLSIALQRALNNSPCCYLFILPCTICFLTTEAFYVSIIQYNYYFRHTNRMIRITALFCFYVDRYRKEGFCYMYSKKQRILAIIGIAALVLLYIITPVSYTHLTPFSAFVLSNSIAAYYLVIFFTHLYFM